MATLSPARPDMEAFRKSVSESISEVSRGLVAILGKKLTAYIGSVKDVRAVDRWVAGKEVYGSLTAERLRLAYRVAKMLLDHNEDVKIIQAWFTGLNPELNDQVPIRLLREGNVEQDGKAVLIAARAFLSGG